MGLTVGQTVGPYHVTARLGHGGMATVYQAYHSNLDRFVAIKVLHPSFKEDPNFLGRFKREAQIIARLDHPNIIPVYDFADVAGQPYLVMKYIDGQTLKQRIRQEPLTIEETLYVLEAVANARPDLCAFPGHFAPRHQTIQHHAGERWNALHHRFWTGADRSSRRVYTEPGHDAGHASVYFAGTGQGSA